MSNPTQLACRTSKDISVLDTAPVYTRLPGFVNPTGNLRCCCYSGDGRFFAWASLEQVTVVDASVGHVVTTIPAANVFELGFSPHGTYIITWQRPSKDENGDAVKNLRVWKTVDDTAGSEGERVAVGQFVQKSQTGWNLQYTADETLCARCVSNEVQFFEPHDLGTVWNKLRAEGVTDFAVSPGKKRALAVFIPERKGLPATVRVYNIPQFDTPVSQKNFFKGDKVQLKWNQDGTSVIVLAQTEVDKTNKSYYGETNMYILSANGDFDSRIQLDKEGPIHDVSWSPNSKEFGVVYGYMPAKTTIFNRHAVIQHSFNLGPRNTILFSPHGRFVIVAGFGNLAGQMDIYDLEKNYYKICTIEASNASVCEWSPDGKHILTATTSPRLRVDNGLRIWHVGGGLMYNENFTELYHVTWRPQSAAQHPLTGDPVNSVPQSHASAIEYLGTVKTPSKPVGAYRPPGARGTSTPLAFKREDQGGEAFIRDGISSTSGNVTNGFGKPRRREVPGAEPANSAAPTPQGQAAPGGGVSLAVAAGDVPGNNEPLSKAALKNKKKREARKTRDADGVGGGATTPTNGDVAAQLPQQPSGGQTGPKRNDVSAQVQQQQQQQQPQQQQAPLTPQKPSAQQPGAQPALVAPLPGLGAGEGTTPDDKQVRALLKKLRAIDDLKMRHASGEKLEGTQLQKIGLEERIRGQLEALGVDA